MKKSALACAVLGVSLALPLLPSAVVTAQAQPAAMCSSVWTVRPGDTLSRIARTCGMPASQIQRANPSINWNRLPVGARISLDGRGGGAPSRPGVPDRYVIQRGDTLASIARIFGVSLEAFRAANPGLTDRDLQVGREIRFGGGQAAPRPPRPGSEERRVDVAVDDRDAVPGGIVSFRVAGLAAGQRIVVAMNPGPGFPGNDTGVRADRRGIATADLRVPQSARPGQRWGWEVLDEGMRPIASGAFRIGESGNAGQPSQSLLRVVGVLSNEGATCPTLRGDDGRLYSLAGDLQGYRGGDRVEITGETGGMSVCMQGTTIGVASIRPAR